MSLFALGTPGSAVSTKTTSTPHEFQAVVLAGHGHRLYPLTEDENVPKALLPVAGRTLISYALSWLESVGIQEIIVAGQNRDADKISTYFSRVYEGTRPDIVYFDDQLGSADVLRRLRDKIKHDFLVVSCDCITTVPAHRVLDLFRTEYPSVSAVALLYDRSLECCAGVPASELPNEISVYGQAPHDDDIIAPYGNLLSNATGSNSISGSGQATQLLYSAAESDLSGSDLSLRMSMLRKFPIVNLSTTLHDAQLYIFKRWVIDLVALNDTLSSIRSDLLPLLLKSQYAPSLPECQKVYQASSGTVLKSFEPPLSVLSHLTDFVIPVPSPLGSHFTLYPASETVATYQQIRVLVHVIRSGVVTRANTVAAYSEISRYLARSAEPRIASTSELNPKSQMGPDSMIGEGSRIGERSSVKKSVIGAHVTIGKNVRLINSVLMDHIVIGDDTKLENVVVCNGVTIHDKCSLKDCIIGGSFIVERETTAKNEKFVQQRDMDE